MTTIFHIVPKKSIFLFVCVGQVGVSTSKKNLFTVSSKSNGMSYVDNHVIIRESLSLV